MKTLWMVGMILAGLGSAAAGSYFAFVAVRYRWLIHHKKEVPADSLVYDTCKDLSTAAQALIMLGLIVMGVVFLMVAANGPTDMPDQPTPISGGFDH